MLLGKALVIVESPAKAKTIEKFLGRKYKVTASMGHVRDLPKSQLGVEVEKGFQPRYITIRGKGEVVQKLREEAKKADRVLLATDPDREGEAISWHLAHLLKLEERQPIRITFHEITKEAVQEAVSHPRPVDKRLVDAQQARRVLDRLVGYKLSPLLWRKVRGGLSAGRVQSVAVRLICDREAEIEAFVPQEYWSLEADLKAEDKAFTARFWGSDGGKVELKTQAQTLAVRDEVRKAEWRVGHVEKKERKRNPALPFTTSTLQQEAARKLGFTVRRTMRVAQELYEGLDVHGEGTVGLITYMRTDSTRVADTAVAEAHAYVLAEFGPDFSQPRKGGAKEGAQDAHEGIRPTRLARTPEQLKQDLSRDQLRLYRLIWERFLASQMAPAVLDTVTAEIIAGRHQFRATGSTLKFAGFMKVYIEGRDEADEEQERQLPALVSGQALTLTKLKPEQHFTQPPPRYTEAMLVRTLEEKGIGRPSTYAPIIETIQQRGYVAKEQKRFKPTELGRLVTDLLKTHFPEVVSVEFTASMEQRLDGIEEGQLPWEEVIADFYRPFADRLAEAEQMIGPVALPEEVTEEICDKCGSPMRIKHGRFGPFLACSAYPECKSTRPLLNKIGVACPRCGAELVERRSRRGRTFFGCSTYPSCDFVSWDRPVSQACPQCGGLMVEKRVRGETELRCVAEGCGHRLEAVPR